MAEPQSETWPPLATHDCPGCPPRPVLPVKMRLPLKAPSEQVAARAAECDNCEELYIAKGWRICAACNCQLEFKALLARASCPKGKWK